MFNENDIKQAISEAIRVTKKGGIIDKNTFKCLSNPSMLFEMYRKEEIDELMSKYQIQRLHFVATDLLTNHMREVINKMDDKLFQAYLNYHFSICEREDMIGITHHSLDIFRKK